MLKAIKSLLVSDKGSLSSKRFCGLLGWIVLLCCLGYASWAGTELPGVTSEFIFGTVALLGVDSVTSIWKTGRNDNNPSEPNESIQGSQGPGPRPRPHRAT